MLSAESRIRTLCGIKKQPAGSLCVGDPAGCIRLFASVYPIFTWPQPTSRPLTRENRVAPSPTKSRWIFCPIL